MQKNRPGFTPAAIERQTQIDIERLQVEAIRRYFHKSENRRIARRNEIHAEALACNIEFDRGAL